MAQLVGHEVHGGSGVGEEGAVGGAEIVERGIGLAGGEEAVLGAAAVAGEEPLALAALLGETVALGASEIGLAMAVGEGRERCVVDVAEAELREDEVVAAIEVAVVLHGKGVAAGGSHGADPWRFANPAGEGGVEELDEDFADIVEKPFVEDGCQVAGVLGGGDGEGGRVCWSADARRLV